MQGSFKLGSIAGIDIRVHYTWLFIFALVTWSLASGFFPSTYPGWSEGTYWTIGAVAALALFASVLIHELSHSFMALARGVGVDSITLFIFGGVSNLKTESEEPKDEFLISVVGPLSSFLLAAIFWAADRALAPGSSPVGAILGYLTMINVLLGAFNLLPGFPLDGGRVFRSIIWGITGSLRKATQVASMVGQGFGFLLIFLGVWQIFGGAFLNGLWTAFIGWFLNNAAEATRQQQVLRENLKGVRVGTLMRTDPPVTGPDTSVQEFVFDHVLHQGRRAVLVGQDNQLLGLVSITDVKELPQDAWATTPVRQIMTPTPLKTVAPDGELSDALEQLVGGEFNQLPVVSRGQLVGMINRSDVLRFLQLRDELEIKRLPTQPGHPNGHARETGMIGAGRERSP